MKEENCMGRRSDKDFNLIELNRPKQSTKEQRVPLEMMDVEDVKKGLGSFFEENPLLATVGSLLLVPYILGFILGFFYFSLLIGVPVSDFLAAFHGTSQLVFWLIGFYLIITFTDVWLLAKKALLSLRA